LHTTNGVFTYWKLRTGLINSYWREEKKKNVKLKVLWWWFDSQSSVHYKNTTFNDITTILLIVQPNALSISRVVSLSVLNIHPEGDLSFSNSCTLVIFVEVLSVSRIILILERLWRKPWDKGMVCAKSVARIFLCESAHHKTRTKQDRQWTYSVTLWCVHVIIMAMETQQCIVCIVNLHVSLSTITYLTTAVQMQRCNTFGIVVQRFYGK